MEKSQNPYRGGAGIAGENRFFLKNLMLVLAFWFLFSYPVSGQNQTETVATPTPAAIPTQTPNSSLLTSHSSKTPIATPTVRTTLPSDPQVNAIPNPVRGKKMTFRVMADGPVKVRIKIYNRVFDPIETLEKEGDKFFDILWKFKDLDEGIYYYQAQVEDANTGKFYKLHLQRFVVLKDEENPE